mmetsp:Transcript_113052/g.330411  ORF Transcript_113052/g.330411 Transcript_113052/m.330411 type:complete len:228 (-) Transcript_113052:443-1126(-)
MGPSSDRSRRPSPRNNERAHALPQRPPSQREAQTSSTRSVAFAARCSDHQHPFRGLQCVLQDHRQADPSCCQAALHDRDTGLVVRLVQVLSARHLLALCVNVGIGAGVLDGLRSDSLHAVLEASFALIAQTVRPGREVLQQVPALELLRPLLRQPRLVQTGLLLHAVNDTKVPDLMEVHVRVMLPALLHLHRVAAPVRGPAHVQRLVDVAHEVDDKLEGDLEVVLAL